MRLLAATDSAASPRKLGAQPGHVGSLRTSILWLVLACLLPLFFLAAYLARQYYVIAMQRLHSQTLFTARDISARLDRELTAIESGLKVLATSQHLASGDLKRFHQQAKDAVRSQIVYNYILTDAEGRQLLNTMRPFGSPLPASGTPPALANVFQTRKTILTDLFEGPVVHRPVVAMGVPVEIGGVVRYSLNIGLDPKALQALLYEEPLSEQWLAVVLDRSATIVARTRNPEKYIGQKAVSDVASRMQKEDEATYETITKEGTPVISSHHRSRTWGWSVAVGANREILDAELRRSLAWLLLGFAGASVIGWGLALWISQRILSHLHILNSVARAVSQGIAQPLPSGGFKETAAIADALSMAAIAMIDTRHRASHDVLTGLANRALFDELAQSQLSRSKREGSGFAILAVDLDHFKEVNDACGHAVGDAVLCEVARRMQATVRSFDVLARLGGDEFLVLLTGADAALSQEVAQRLIEAVSQAYEETTVAVAASVGIALYPDHGDTIRQLFVHADQALYEAKRQGRKCAVVWHAS